MALKTETASSLLNPRKPIRPFVLIPLYSNIDHSRQNDLKTRLLNSLFLFCKLSQGSWVSNKTEQSSDGRHVS